MEGVGGTSTPTRGSVWFHVSGVEDGAEKIGVEAYVLKKVSRDLPLHPIPIALKWDHLSNLELADPEFRTPARANFFFWTRFQDLVTSAHARTPSRNATPYYYTYIVFSHGQFN